MHEQGGMQTGYAPTSRKIQAGQDTLSRKSSIFQELALEVYPALHEQKKRLREQVKQREKRGGRMRLIGPIRPINLYALRFPANAASTSRLSPTSSQSPIIRLRSVMLSGMGR
jgi:hypothetical protein